MTLRDAISGFAEELDRKVAQCRELAKHSHPRDALTLRGKEYAFEDDARRLRQLLALHEENQQ